MRGAARTALLLLAIVPAMAQNPAEQKTERATIDRAKSVLVSSLDRTLPRVSLEFFLANESGGARIQWEVNDCGEETGSPEVDRGRDFPVCVEAEVFLKDQRSLNVSLVVGTVKKGVSDKPWLWGVTLTENDGKVRPIALRQVPVELHRPDRPEPKQLPPPVDRKG
jgi:hypothetical protein